MSWIQIAGLVLFVLILLVCLWPRGGRSRDKQSGDGDSDSGGHGARGGAHGAGGSFGGAGNSDSWTDHGGGGGGHHGR